MEWLFGKMELKDLAWLFSVISIIACSYNVRKKKICFIIWFASNAGFIWLNFVTELYGQIPLWVAFTLLNIYGYFQWSKDELSFKGNWFFCKIGLHDWIIMKHRCGGEETVEKFCRLCPKTKKKEAKLYK